MRVARVIGAVMAVALVVGAGLALSGKLPWAAHQLNAVASAWTDPSDSGPAADAGLRNAGADAAIKVQAGPLSSAQLSAPLYHVTFLSDCGAPPEMKVVLKATVKMGRAIDVLAKTDPPDPNIEACIERAASALHWDASRKADKLTVRY
jgi:hypothetical protein